MELVWHADPGRRGSVTVEELAALYAFPEAGALRANFVSTLDGAGVGPDGLTGSINTPPDNLVFALLRAACDVVLVGAGTAQAEGYRATRPGEGTAATIAVTSNRARVPDGLRMPPPPGAGAVVLVTCEQAGQDALAAARDSLGGDAVWVCGEDQVDLDAAVDRLRRAGLTRILCEGGPTLFAGLLDRGLVDELALTLVPTLVGGQVTRITSGAAYRRGLEPVHLLAEDGTVLGLWRIARG